MKNVLVDGMLERGYRLVDDFHIESIRGKMYYVNSWICGNELLIDVKNMNNNKVASSQKVVKDLIAVGVSLGYQFPKCRNIKYKYYYMVAQ